MTQYKVLIGCLLLLLVPSRGLSASSTTQQSVDSTVESTTPLPTTSSLTSLSSTFLNATAQSPDETSHSTADAGLNTVTAVPGTPSSTLQPIPPLLSIPQTIVHVYLTPTIPLTLTPTAKATTEAQITLTPTLQPPGTTPTTVGSAPIANSGVSETSAPATSQPTAASSATDQSTSFLASQQTLSTSSQSTLLTPSQSQPTTSSNQPSSSTTDKLSSIYQQTLSKSSQLTLLTSPQAQTAITSHSSSSSSASTPATWTGTGSQPTSLSSTTGTVSSGSIATTAMSSTGQATAAVTTSVAPSSDASTTTATPTLTTGEQRMTPEPTTATTITNLTTAGATSVATNTTLEATTRVQDTTTSPSLTTTITTTTTTTTKTTTINKPTDTPTTTSATVSSTSAAITQKTTSAVDTATSTSRSVTASTSTEPVKTTAPPSDFGNAERIRLGSRIKDLEDTNQSLLVGVSVLAGVLAFVLLIVIFVFIVKRCRGGRRRPEVEFPDGDIHIHPVRRSRHYFRPRSVFDFLEQKVGRSSENIGGPKDSTVDRSTNGQSTPFNVSSFRMAEGTGIGEDVFENPVNKRNTGYSSFGKRKGKEIAASEDNSLQSVDTEASDGL